MFITGRVRSIVIGVSVCLSVSPLAYLKNHMSNLHEVYKNFDE